ncbi:DNA ligase D [Thalassobacillus hwangdonensis]|uniref:DNA ligase (ATP) n=1 Tax=Thalassobacillus hwangdonensis TaxID=546108 RepID=A0ABW3KWX2_9BACI
MSYETMQPTLATELPKGSEWVYEVKYDGFRCLLKWEKESIQLISRNGKSLTKQFPEIVQRCEELQDLVEVALPLTLDGELVILNTPVQANFSLLQTRSRMGTASKIQEWCKKRSAQFLAFDLLRMRGKSLERRTHEKRKQQLAGLFERAKLPDGVKVGTQLCLIETYTDVNEVHKRVTEHQGEGIIAKRKNSQYKKGKVDSWIKIKNWRILTAFLTGYQPSNGYFSVGFMDDGEVIALGKCKHGLSRKDEEELIEVIKSKGSKKGNSYHLPPAICMDIHCLGIHDKELREPSFKSFRLEADSASCTRSSIRWQLSSPPSSIAYSNLDKLLYPAHRKQEVIQYLRNVYPYMEPFIHGKRLTVIRYPDGIEASSFFQKHLPEYAPDFLKRMDDHSQLVENVEGFIWFANQAAIEYHIPFQKIDEAHPDEIVFDLDPADIDQFPDAKRAAQHLHTLFQELGLISFVKTSGGKGMQVHIPITSGSLTYEQTSIFTAIIAETLVHFEPDAFTTERLKKNRKGRLYIDHVQHAPGKTIIAPYSPRAYPYASVSTPLFWEELGEVEHPSQFTIANTLERLQRNGCPFSTYHQAKVQQPMERLKAFIEHGTF